MLLLIGYDCKEKTTFNNAKINKLVLCHSTLTDPNSSYVGSLPKTTPLPPVPMGTWGLGDNPKNKKKIVKSKQKIDKNDQKFQTL